MNHIKSLVVFLAIASFPGCGFGQPDQLAKPEPPKRTVSAEAEKAARELVKPHALILEWNVPYQGDASYRAIFVHELDDAALESIIPALKQLHPYDLCFSQTKITQAGLAQLTQFDTLTNLNLSKTSVNDRSLAILKPLTKLDQLDLSDTAITDDGLVHLCEFKRLERLGLSGTAVSDAALVQLKRLANLKYLSLDRSAVTDAGLLQLAQLPGLRTLSVSNDHITAAGINALKQALPKLLVSAVEPPPEPKKRGTATESNTTLRSARTAKPNRALPDRLPPRRDSNRRSRNANTEPPTLQRHALETTP